MNETPTLTELIDLFEKGEIKEEGKIYEVYLTERHKESKTIGWIHDAEFKGWVKVREHMRKKEPELFWGKQ